MWELEELWWRSVGSWRRCGGESLGAGGGVEEKCEVLAELWSSSERQVGQQRLGLSRSRQLNRRAIGPKQPELPKNLDSNLLQPPPFTSG